MSAAAVARTLKPYLWLALAAFLAGFLSFVLVGGARAPAHNGTAEAPLASSPASDAWNLPRQI